jgi:hypothetical protein
MHPTAANFVAGSGGAIPRATCYMFQKCFATYLNGRVPAKTGWRRSRGPGSPRPAFGGHMASRSLIMRRPVRRAVQPISHNPAMQDPWKLSEAVTSINLPVGWSPRTSIPTSLLYSEYGGTIYTSSDVWEARRNDEGRHPGIEGDEPYLSTPPIAQCRARSQLSACWWRRPGTSSPRHLLRRAQ